MQIMIADNYIEFGERLTGLVRTKKISKKLIADKIGRSYEMVRRYCKGISMPEDEVTMSLLAESVGSTSQYLRYGIIDFDELHYAAATSQKTNFEIKEPQKSLIAFTATPKSDSKKCAFPFIGVTSDCNIVESGEYQTPFSENDLKAMEIDKNKCKMMRIEGKSMHKVFSPGDVVCIDMSKTRVVEAAPYAVMDGNLLRIRYLIERGDGSLILRSENQTAFPDEIIEKENREERIKIIGAVWWSAKIWI